MMTPVFSDFAAFQEILAVRYQRDIALISACLSRGALPILNMYDGLEGPDFSFDVSDLVFEEGTYDERSGYRAPVGYVNITCYNPNAAYGLLIRVHEDGKYHVLFKNGDEDRYVVCERAKLVQELIEEWVRIFRNGETLNKQNFQSLKK